jgi:hypothetical protein
MGVAWEDQKTEEKEQPSHGLTSSGISWKEVEPDVTPGGVTAAFISGINTGLFHLTGGSSLEYFMDEMVPSSAARGMGYIIDWGKDWTGVTYEPENSTERVMRRAGEDLTLGAAVSAAALSTGGTAAPLVAGARFGSTSAMSSVPLTNTAQRLTNNILQAFKNNPAAASIYEMIGTAGAGAGMQAAEESGAGPVGQTMAGLAGAITPLAPVVVYKGLQYTTIGLFRKLFKESNKRAFQEVAKALDTGIGDMSDVAKSNQVFVNIGAKTRPTVAESSNSPQLIARQRQIESESVGSELDHYVKLHRDKLSDVQERAEVIGPEKSYRDADIVIDVARSELQAQRSGVQSGLKDVDAARGASGRSLPEATDRIAAGRQLKDLRSTLRENVKTRLDERADDIGLNGPNAEFDATPLRNAMRRRFFDKRSKLAGKVKNKTLKRINKFPEEVDDAGKPTGLVKMTWEDLKSARELLNDDISKALASRQRNKAREPIAAVKMIDNFVAQNAPNGVDAKAWAQFRASYKEQLIDRFELGTAYKIKGANQRGEYFTNEEMVAEAFLKNESTVADFFRLYGNQADEALPLLRTAILDKARQASVRNGVINEAALAKFIDTGPLSKVLRAFPSIRTELKTINQAQKSLSLREAQLKARGNEIEASALKRIVGVSDDPDTVIDAALKDPRKMQALVDSSMKAGLGKRPVASIIWQRAIQKISNGTEPTPEQLLKFITDNRRSLNVALSKRHAENLRYIYEALEIISRVGAPKGSVEPFSAPDKLRDITGISVPQAASRTYAYSAGLIGKRHMMFESAMRLYGKIAGRRAKALMKEALYDEQIARDIRSLMESPSLERSQKLQSMPEARLNAALFTMGFGDQEDQ